MDAAAGSGASAVVNQLAQHGADLNAAAPMNWRIGWTIWIDLDERLRVRCATRGVYFVWILIGPRNIGTLLIHIYSESILLCARHINVHTFAGLCCWLYHHPFFKSILWF